MRRFVPAICFVLAIYMDYVLFPNVNLFGVVPDTLLAVLVSYSILRGRLPGMIVGGCLGLLTDILFGKFIGLNALLYAGCAAAAGFFYRKFYADNIIVPIATAAICSFVKENVMAGIVTIMGASYHYGMMLARFILPGVLITAGVCMLTHLALKPAVIKNFNRRSDRNLRSGK